MTKPASRRQTVLYPDAPAGSLAAKRPPVENGTGTITGDRYYRKDIFEAEWNRIWTRTWHLAGPLCDLKNPGDFFTFSFMHESFLIVMQTDRTIKAFYNVCPHRGNRLVYAENGTLPAFSCVYHGWKFAVDGNRLSMKDPESFEGIDTSSGACLSSVRCEVHAGLVWINMDDGALPVKEALGLPEGLLECYRMDEMVTVSRQVQEVAGNWKLALENVTEAYHFDVVHEPFRLAEFCNPMAAQIDLHPNGASSWFIPFGQPSFKLDQEEINESLKGYLRMSGIDPATFKGTAQDVRRAVQRLKRDHAVKAGFDVSNFLDEQFTDTWGVSTFPATLLAMNFEVVLLQRLQPHPTDPERYYMTPIVLYRPGSVSGKGLPPFLTVPGMDLNPKSIPATRHYSLQADGFQLGPLIAEDVDIIAKTLLGVKSRGYKGPIWGEQEQRLRHFHKEYDRYMNAEK